MLSLQAASAYRTVACGPVGQGQAAKLVTKATKPLECLTDALQAMGTLRHRAFRRR